MSSSHKGYAIEDISEVLVTLVDGRQFIYREKGILNLKRMLNTPPVRSKQRKEITVINDEEEDEEDQGNLASASEPLKRIPERPQTSNGYNLIPLNYSAPKGGKSPMDIAKDLQRQAEAASGVKY